MPNGFSSAEANRGVLVRSPAPRRLIARHLAGCPCPIVGKLDESLSAGQTFGVARRSLLRLGLLASGAVLLVNDVLDMSYRQQYLILTGVGGLALDLQFRTRSDPTLVNLEPKAV
jgi:hypothetical protein